MKGRSAEALTLTKKAFVYARYGKSDGFSRFFFLVRTGWTYKWEEALKRDRLQGKRLGKSDGFSRFPADRSSIPVLLRQPIFKKNSPNRSFLLASVTG